MLKNQNEQTILHTMQMPFNTSQYIKKTIYTQARVEARETRFVYYFGPFFLFNISLFRLLVRFHPTHCCLINHFNEHELI